MIIESSILHRLIELLKRTAQEHFEFLVNRHGNENQPELFKHCIHGIQFDGKNAPVCSCIVEQQALRSMSIWASCSLSLLSTSASKTITGSTTFASFYARRRVTLPLISSLNTFLITGGPSKLE